MAFIRLGRGMKQKSTVLHLLQMDLIGAAKGGQLGSPQTWLCRQTQGIWIPVRNTNNRIRKQQQQLQQQRNCKEFLKSKKYLDLFLRKLRILQRKQMVGLNKIQVHLAGNPLPLAMVHAILLMYYKLCLEYSTVLSSRLHYNFSFLTTHTEKSKDTKNTNFSRLCFYYSEIFSRIGVKPGNQQHRQRSDPGTPHYFCFQTNCRTELAVIEITLWMLTPHYTQPITLNTWKQEFWFLSVLSLLSLLGYSWKKNRRYLISRVLSQREALNRTEDFTKSQQCHVSRYPALNTQEFISQNTGL